MKDETILKKAIEKAKKNGLDNYSIFEDWDINSHASIRGVIFSHSFAKAFWGDKDKIPIVRENSWKVHLSKMVLEPKPLRYLAKFI